MTKKLLFFLTRFLLVLLPFLAGVGIGNYSPYVETNSFTTYLMIWAAISIAIAAVVFYLSKYYSRSSGSLFMAALWLFLLIIPIIGIIGFAAPPDLSIKMLDHPEREHLRYVFLFIAALFFAGFSFSFIKKNGLDVKNPARQILMMLFVLAFVEFIWEFTHHYLYPEALKEWIAQGNKAEEFIKEYDSKTFITIGALGRLLLFALLIWLSIQLYKRRHIKLWTPILIIPFSLLGIASAIVVYATQMNLPKGFEIMFLFFIPGMPFLLFYWLGVGLLTTFKKREIVG